jgi:hypothetical protein
MRRLTLATVLVVVSALSAQQNYTNTAPLQRYNAKYNNGVGTGYWPTAGSGLTLDIAGGTAFCNGTIVTYAAGTLTMTASQTNYVYLDSTVSCAPASNTTGFTSAQIPIATVVAGSSTITTITDVRSFFSIGTLPLQVIVSSGSISVTQDNAYVICTTTCTVTPLTPSASPVTQLCVRNAPGVSTAITMAALGSGNYYELTSHASWGTANHTQVSGGAATDAICYVGYDANHYAVFSYNGTWTD